MLKAITRKATAVDEKIKQLPGGPVSTAYFFDHFATPDDVAVMVTEEDFTRAQSEMVPSVRYVTSSQYLTRLLKEIC
jgi:peroxin-6